ncbi:MAG: hypothetical protein LAQ30_13250 [Acidobacteriia bacterium]|nr:hypothetical protein [Terriglobia bacterium]
MPFAALSADDIDVTRSPSAGVAALKTFLQYAQNGNTETSAPTERPPDSDFEEQVRRELEGQGYTVHAQVGCAGFFIDTERCALARGTGKHDQTVVIEQVVRNADQQAPEWQHGCD